MAMAICGKSMEVWEMTLGTVRLEGFIGPIPAAIKNTVLHPWAAKVLLEEGYQCLGYPLRTDPILGDVKFLYEQKEQF